MKALPWFRLYTEMIDDEKLGLLAFEDRWHFVALLCLKGKGVLDSEPDMELLQRKVAFKLGLTCAELEKVAHRLAKMSLIDRDTFQPAAWGERQMQSDVDTTNALRQQRYREKNKGVTADKALRNGPVTGTDTEADTEAEKEKRGEEATRAEPKVAVAPATLDDVPIDLMNDWVAVRKAKKAGPVTATVLKGLDREAAKAGVSRQVAIEACCEFGWQGFNATWYAERTAGKRQPTAYQARQDKESAWMAAMTSPANVLPGAPHDNAYPNFFDRASAIDTESRFLD